MQFGKPTPNDGRLDRDGWPSGTNLGKRERFKFCNIRPTGQRLGNILHQRKFLRARKKELAVSVAICVHKHFEMPEQTWSVLHLIDDHW
jgi:hypothetical protein